MMNVMDQKRDTSAELPKRKAIRWKGYDYSLPGAYFITICIEKRKNLLSTVVGEGLAPPETRLRPCGKIAEDQLHFLERRYSNVSVDRYVVMPNHIHFILFLRGEAGGASPSPTVSDVICSFKSLTSRICKMRYGVEKLFQRSYIDHVIRDRRDYETRAKYISENPLRWHDDEMYCEDTAN
jgi:REP element-mobilizing transposase RayT